MKLHVYSSIKLHEISWNRANFMKHLKFHSISDVSWNSCCNQKLSWNFSNFSFLWNFLANVAWNFINNGKYVKFHESGMFKWKSYMCWCVKFHEFHDFHFSWNFSFQNLWPLDLPLVHCEWFVALRKKVIFNSKRRSKMNPTTTLSDN